METSEKTRSFWSQIRSFPANFWFANFMEILERLAFFGVRAIAPLYLVASAGENGLGLDYWEKGIIYFVWALLQCFIPMFSGGYTERYGYRKSLAVAFTINIIGYLGMAQSKPITDYFLQQGWESAGFWVFLMAACLVGTGTAIFKPPCWGAVAKGVTEETSSVGWGMFYWVVNIGGALAPMCAALLRVEVDWDRVFYAAAIVTAANFLPAFLLFKEPKKTPERKDAEKTQGLFTVFISSVVTVVRDRRLVSFLLISSCFWFLFMQLWDLLPNFVDEWIDTSDVAPTFAWVSQWFGGGWVLESGQTKPEMIININPWSIIVLVIPLSWLIRKIHKVAAMAIGMSIAVVGCVGAGATTIGWMCCVMILVFSIGEMTCSPTFNAYVGLIAPKDKKAQYMGYANIPFAIGWAVGNLVSGFLYENIASKFKLARQYMVDQLSMDPHFVLDEAMLPKEKVMETMAFVRDGGSGSAISQAAQAFWDKLPDVEVLTREQSRELLASIDKVLGGQSVASVQEATRVLWDMHHPYLVWCYLGVVGLVGTLGMIIFYFATRKTRTEASAYSAEP